MSTWLYNTSLTSCRTLATTVGTLCQVRASPRAWGSPARQGVQGGRAGTGDSQVSAVSRQEKRSPGSSTAHRAPAQPRLPPHGPVLASVEALARLPLGPGPGSRAPRDLAPARLSDFAARGPLEGRKRGLGAAPPTSSCRPRSPRSAQGLPQGRDHPEQGARPLLPTHSSFG